MRVRDARLAAAWFPFVRYRGERPPSVLSVRKSVANSPAAIAAATSSPGVSAGEGRRTLNPEVAGSIPAGATCRRGVIRRAYGPVTAVIRVQIPASAWMRGVATWGYPSREAYAAGAIITDRLAVIGPEGSATSMLRCGIPGIPRSTPL